MTVSVINDLDEFYNNVQTELKNSAKDFVAQMSPANVDFSLIGEPAFSSKNKTLGNKKFRVNIFTDQRVTDTMSNHTGKPVASVIQIWNGANSAIMLCSPYELEDARKNWNNEYRIAEDDLVSQTVSAMRLRSNERVIHNLCMWLAYDCEGVDAAGCHSVWD